MTEPVLILTGPPGTGKTTTARQLAGDHERAVHLQSDIFFDFIRAGFVAPWLPESYEQNSVVMRIVAAKQLWHSFADLGPFERHTIDVDGEAAQVVSQRLRDGSLALR